MLNRITHARTHACARSETIEVTIIKLGTVTASDINATRANYIDLDLHSRINTDYIDFNHENNKCSIISEIVQAVPIKFVVKIVRLKMYIICSPSDDLALHSRSQLRLNLDTCENFYYNSHISDSINKLWYPNLAWRYTSWHICSCSFRWPWPWCKVIVGR